MTELEPFQGVWTGIMSGKVGGAVRLTVALPDPSGPAEAELEVDALGAAMPFTNLTVSGGTLEADMGPTRVRIRRQEHVLQGAVTSALLPDLEFELRRGHPGIAPYGVPGRVCSERAPVHPGVAGALVAGVEEGTLPWVDGLVLLQDGSTVLDEHFYGRTRDDLRCIHSATKSVTALLLGTLVDEGAVDLDEPAWRYLKHRSGHRWVDERYDITVHQVLSMAARLQWDEEETSYLDPANDAVRMNAAPDWVGYVLDRPMRDSPGSQFSYQSGLSMLMGELIRSAGFAPVHVLAEERLFQPLGIERFHWMTAADGTCHTGGGLWLTPRDFAKCGELVLQEGQWNGQQLISSEWIRRCTSPQTEPVGPVPPHPRMSAYGYQWWLLDTELDGVTVRSASALGHGGQVLHVLRDLDTVVVATAHDWHGTDEFAGQLLDLVLRSDSRASGIESAEHAGTQTR